MSGKTSVVSNEKFDVKVLESLRKAFDAANVDNDPGLNLEEFVNAFSKILGKDQSTQFLINLYMKIDANSDGKVDWSEFLEFMLLEKAGNELMKEAELSTMFKKVCKFYNSFFFLDGNLTEDGFGKLPHVPKENCHKRPILHIKYFPEVNYYVTCSRDSLIKIWNHSGLDISLNLIRSMHCPPSITQSFKKRNAINDRVKLIDEASHAQKMSQLEKVSHRKVVIDDYSSSSAWPEDVVHMVNSLTLAVACSNRSINFYDSRTFTLTGRLRPLIDPPTCLAYCYLKDEESENLAFGDSAGRITIFALNERNWHFPDNTHHSCRGEKPTGIIKKNTFSVHVDAVTCLKYCHFAKMFIAGSLDGCFSLFCALKLQLKGKYTKHLKSVLCLDIFAQKKNIISGGMNQVIHFWNPFTTTLTFVFLLKHQCLGN